MKKHALLEALRDTRELLARLDNDFAWSAWKDADAALRELDALIECVRSDAVPDSQQLRALFAPTGPIQEVSLSGGWADTFLGLADRIDDAMR
jgi:hypothetical protein